MTNLILKRIMLVEDEPDIQILAKLALEAVGGFTVEVCSNGREALSRVTQFSPELIVLDVMMPGMDGPSTLLALREMPLIASIPIIFMTAKVQAEEVGQYRKLGALDVIAKPFDPLTLSATISRIWNDHNA